MLMNKVYSGIFVVFAFAGVCFSQAESRRRDEPSARDSNRSRQAALMSGTSVSGELQKTIDVNNARIGDRVVLRTTQSVRQDGQIVVPKGSNLIGRITEIQRRSKDNAQSRIGLVFERIEGRQMSIPLSATIVSITNAALRTTANDSFESDVSSQTSASTSRNNSGGGLLGGVGNTVGGLVNGTTQTAGRVTNTAGKTLGSTAGTVVHTLNGIRLTTDASGSANSSTTLSSSDRNLRVENGATFNLRVAH